MQTQRFAVQYVHSINAEEGRGHGAHHDHPVFGWTGGWIRWLVSEVA
jgi:hypothetical protein